LLGLATLTGLIIFISVVNGAVDTKLILHKTTEEEPPFKYRYGMSFICAVCSFFMQEINGICNIYWYIEYYLKRLAIKNRQKLIQPSSDGLVSRRPSTPLRYQHRSMTSLASLVPRQNEANNNNNASIFKFNDSNDERKSSSSPAAAAATTTTNCPYPSVSIRESTQKSNESPANIIGFKNVINNDQHPDDVIITNVKDSMKRMDRIIKESPSPSISPSISQSPSLNEPKKPSLTTTTTTLKNENENESNLYPKEKYKLFADICRNTKAYLDKIYSKEHLFTNQSDNNNNNNDKLEYPNGIERLNRRSSDSYSLTSSSSTSSSTTSKLERFPIVKNEIISSIVGLNDTHKSYLKRIFQHINADNDKTIETPPFESKNKPFSTISQQKDNNINEKVKSTWLNAHKQVINNQKYNNRSETENYHPSNLHQNSFKTSTKGGNNSIKFDKKNVTFNTKIINENATKKVSNSSSTPLFKAETKFLNSSESFDESSYPLDFNEPNYDNLYQIEDNSLAPITVDNSNSQDDDDNSNNNNITQYYIDSSVLKIFEPQRHRQQLHNLSTSSTTIPLIATKIHSNLPSNNAINTQYKSDHSSTQAPTNLNLTAKTIKNELKIHSQNNKVVDIKKRNKHKKMHRDRRQQHYDNIQISDTPTKSLSSPTPTTPPFNRDDYNKSLLDFKYKPEMLNHCDDDYEYDYELYNSFPFENEMRNVYSPHLRHASSQTSINSDRTSSTLTNIQQKATTKTKCHRSCCLNKTISCNLASLQTSSIITTTTPILQTQNINYNNNNVLPTPRALSEYPLTSTIKSLEEKEPFIKNNDSNNKDKRYNNYSFSNNKNRERFDFHQKIDDNNNESLLKIKNPKFIFHHHHEIASNFSPNSYVNLQQPPTMNKPNFFDSNHNSFHFINNNNNKNTQNDHKSKINDNNTFYITEKDDTSNFSLIHSKMTNNNNTRQHRIKKRQNMMRRNASMQNDDFKYKKYCPITKYVIDNDEIDGDSNNNNENARKYNFILNQNSCFSQVIVCRPLNNNSVMMEPPSSSSSSHMITTQPLLTIAGENIQDSTYSSTSQTKRLKRTTSV
jgi:hypothetical protein